MKNTNKTNNYYNHEEYREQQQKRMEELKEKVKSNFHNKIKDGKYLEILKTIAKFYSYSFHNQLMIASQDPDAEYVASYVKWKTDFNRSIKKGEKALYIYAPITLIYAYKDSEGNKIKKTEYATLTDDQKKLYSPVKMNTFKLVPVFDITQTEGDDSKVECLKPTTLHGEVEKFDELMAALSKIVPEYEINFIDKYSEYQSTGGYCANGFDKKWIVVYNDDQKQMLSVAIHEVAHALLHMDKKNKLSTSSKEVQAESVAYTVMELLGLSSDEVSVDYLSSWIRKEELTDKYLEDGFESISNASRKIFEALQQVLRPVAIA